MTRKTLLLIGVGASALLLLATMNVWADDPFAGGEDALAVAADDGSRSVRAKLKLTKMGGDMIMVRVKSVDDSKFPHCIMRARVLKGAAKKVKHLKLLGEGKTYAFSPVYKLKRKKLDLANKMNQNNLGACYYPKKTKLVVKVSGVDFKAKVFKAAEIYLK